MCWVRDRRPGEQHHSQHPRGDSPMKTGSFFSAAAAACALILVPFLSACSGDIDVSPTNQVLLGLDSYSIVNMIDPATGAYYPVLPLYEGTPGIAPTALELAYAPSSGTLYAGKSTVYTVDMLTGAATVYGTGPGVMPGIAVNGAGTVHGYYKATGQLYAFPGGSATLIGSTGLTGNGNGMAFGPDDTLYLGNDTTLYTLDATNGAASAVAGGYTYNTAQFQAVDPFFPSAPRISSLAARADGRLVGTLNDGFNYLVTVDPATAAVSLIGTLPLGLEGLTFVPAGAFVLPPLPVPAACTSTVALFTNTAYVDYIVGNSGSEASNMEALLAQRGCTPNTFTGITAAEITAATVGVTALIIPELEIGWLSAAIDAAAQTAISDFVNGGGTLIISYPGSDIAFPNGVFGWSLVENFPVYSALNATAATGTPFAGGPPLLVDNSATEAFTAASLPSGAISIYATGSDSMVVLIPVGAGHVVLLGWDWFDAAPVGSTDGGWNEVLVRATQF